MRILYTVLKYDYGEPEHGYSYEHNNFFDALHRMGNDMIYFDFGTLLKAHGRTAMNQRLLEVARAEKPDMLFASLFRDEIEPRVMRDISESTDVTTLNWFADDHWRFENFSSRWAPCFNWVVTTANSALAKYRAIGFDRVIKSQWACDHFQYRRMDLPKKYDVTFVGQPHGDRRAVVRKLKRAGLDVRVWGGGWASGRVSQANMIQIFNQSRINLNLSNSSLPATQTARVVAAFNRLLEGAPLPGVPRDAVAGELVALAARTLRPTAPTPAQIKGRNFEVPGCGGFLLTDEAENLSDYYVPDREVVTFANTESLVDRIRYFLSHDEERECIAAAGYQRTLAEHTYVHRFADIFKRVGFQVPPLPDLLAERVPRGHVDEVQ
jgi:spore maturation protein CgeB